MNRNEEIEAKELVVRELEANKLGVSLYDSSSSIPQTFALLTLTVQK